MNKQNTRLLYLDGMRGIAALLVAVYHFSASSAITNVGFIANGWLSVDLFFVISGMVLDRVYFSKPELNFKAYLAARMSRMLPLFFIMTIIFILMDGAVLMSRGSGLGDLVEPIIVNLVALQSFGILDRLWFYGPSWSISAELWMNILIFPIFFFRFKFIVMGALVLMGVILFNGMIDIQTSHQFGWVRCLYGLAVGVLLSRVSLKPLTGIQTNNPLTLGISALWFVGLYIAFSIPSTFGFAPIIFGLLIYFVATGVAPVVEAILSSRPMVFLGKISFALYMTHFLIGGRIMRVIVPFIDRKLGLGMTEKTDGKKWDGLVLGTNEAEGLMFIAVYLICVVVVATLVFKLVEIPLYKVVHSRMKSSLGVEKAPVSAS